MSLQKLATKFSKSNKEKDQKYSYLKEDFTIIFIQKTARPIAVFFNRFPFITPNRVTWMGYIWMLIGSSLLYLLKNQEDSFELRIFLFLVGFFYWLSALFDSVDGQLARLRGITSKKGEWLDSVLEDGKGIPFFVAMGFYIQNNDGNAVLWLFGNSLLTYSVWFTLFIMVAAHLWVNSMAFYNTKVLGEPQIVSHGNYYIVWLCLIFNILNWFLFIFTIGVVLAVIWTLIHRTFILPLNPPNANDKIEE